MDIVAIERAFTHWVALKLDKTVDVDIFRGGFPEGINSGIAALCNNEIKDAVRITHRTYNMQALGKFSSRDEALAMISKLNGAVPVWGIRVTVSSDGKRVETLFKAILPRGSAEPFTVADGDVITHCASVNFLVSVLTTGTQI